MGYIIKNKIIYGGSSAGETGPINASTVEYSNETSGLTAENVQSALDELADINAEDVKYTSRVFSHYDEDDEPVFVEEETNVKENLDNLNSYMLEFSNYIVSIMGKVAGRLPIKQSFTDLSLTPMSLDPQPIVIRTSHGDIFFEYTTDKQMRYVGNTLDNNNFSYKIQGAKVSIHSTTAIDGALIISNSGLWNDLSDILTSVISIPITGSLAGIVHNSDVLTSIEEVEANTDSNKLVNALTIKELKSNFQDGVDSIYDAVVSKGTTPVSKSLADIVAGINEISSGFGHFDGFLQVDMRGAGLNTYYGHYFNNVKTEKNGATTGTHSYNFGNVTVKQETYKMTFTFPQKINGYLTLVQQDTTASRTCHFYVLKDVDSYTVNPTWTNNAIVWNLSFSPSDSVNNSIVYIDNVNTSKEIIQIPCYIIEDDIFLHIKGNVDYSSIYNNGGTCNIQINLSKLGNSFQNIQGVNHPTVSISGTTMTIGGDLTPGAVNKVLNLIVHLKRIS